MKKLIVDLIMFITFNKVRGQGFDNPDLSWWYIDCSFTERFNHGKWICLNYNWMKRFWNMHYKYE